MRFLSSRLLSWEINFILAASSLIHFSIAIVSATCKSSHQRCSAKKGVLRKNTFARVSFLINFIKKETLAQVFSCEFCEISKSTFFCRTPLVAASAHLCLKHANHRLNYMSGFCGCRLAHYHRASLFFFLVK